MLHFYSSNEHKNVLFEMSFLFALSVNSSFIVQETLKTLRLIWFKVRNCFSSNLFYHLESPEPGTYNFVDGFTKDLTFRTTLPKSNYYSFGLGPTREAMESIYLPGNNSPRLKDSKNMPGPAEYKFSNYCIGKEARKF